MAKKAKILAVILIFGCVLIFPVIAETEWTRIDLQNIYIEHLREEGYLPTVDVDGDIQFKVSGDNYFIIIDEKDLQFFQIYMGFSLGAISFEDAVAAANHANRRSKVAKITISPSAVSGVNGAYAPAGGIASITIELLLNDPREFKPVFARALSLIRNAESIFRNNLREMP